MFKKTIRKKSICLSFDDNINENIVVIDYNDIENEKKKDAKELAESVLILKSISKDINDLLNQQGKELNTSNKKIEITEEVLLESNIDLEKAKSYHSKNKYIPIVIGASLGATIAGVPSLFFLGSYSILTTLGGSALGGIVGKLII